MLPFGAQQAVRLVTNIVLTRLLAPEVFGIMLLINSLRTGTELLSDIGIGQSVVRSPHGDERDFLDTAWTLQVLRGLLLTVFTLAAAVPVAALYGKPDLVPLIAATSLVFVLTGLQSAGMFSTQRRMQLKRRAVFSVVSVLASSAITIALAVAIKSVWALVIALVAGTFVTTVLSFAILERRLPRLRWERAHVREIFSFGKWIFLSTAIYFAATTFDRLYLVGSVALALAGIYGVARTFSDLLAALAGRVGALIVFPRAAAAHNAGTDFKHRLRRTRAKTLALVAAATGVAIAGSDKFILLAYDDRYHAAAFMVPLLIAGVWFAILSTFAESLLMGAGRPAPGAWANLVKFAVMLVGLPLALVHGSFLEALLVLVAADIARWMVLLPFARAAQLGRLRDDLALTLLMGLVALAAKAALSAPGWVPSISEWWDMRGLLRNV